MLAAASPAAARPCSRHSYGSHLLKLCPQRGMRAVQRRADRAWTDFQHMTDRLIVEVGEIPEKKTKPLPLRQACNRRTHVVDLGHCWARLLLLGHPVNRDISPTRAHITGGVDNDPPQPPLDLACTPIGVPPRDRPHEPVLHSIGSEFDIASDRRCHVQELSVTQTVRTLDPLELQVALSHRSSRLSRTGSSFSPHQKDRMRGTVSLVHRRVTSPYAPLRRL